MRKRSRTSGSDANQMTSKLIDDAAGEMPGEKPDEGKNPAAVALGRLGGLKGGKARAAKLSSKQRKEIARRAATIRWGRQE